MKSNRGKQEYGRIRSQTSRVATFLGIAILPIAFSAQGDSLLLSESAASPIDSDIFIEHDAVLIDMAEMDELRGGFSIAGMQLEFGAMLETLIDNNVGLRTLLNFTEAGTEVVSQQVSNLPAGGQFVSPTSGNSVVDVAPPTVNIPGLADFTGLTINDAKGFTAALHNITRNSILSAVVSNSSGRSVQQTIDISVKINNISEIQAARTRASVMRSLEGVL